MRPRYSNSTRGLLYAKSVKTTLFLSAVGWGHMESKMDREYSQGYMINGVMVETVVRVSDEGTDAKERLVKTIVTDVKTGECTVYGVEKANVQHKQ